MARQVRVIMTDDFDGSEDARTVEFSLNNESYSIDLSEANEAKLRSALEPFIAKAERVGRRGGSRGQKSRRSNRRTTEIREWARANGHEVSDRGRVSAKVMEAYEAAH